MAICKRCKKKIRNMGVSENKVEKAIEMISNGFTWDKTKQGFDYWYQVECNLMELLK